MQYAILLLVLSCTVYGSVSRQGGAIKPLVATEEYIHSKIVDDDSPNQYQIFWKFDNDTIQFELHCKSKGWVGLGFSPNGGMKGKMKFRHTHMYANIGSC